MLQKLAIFSSAGEERRDFIARVREERQGWKSVCNAANWKDPEFPGFPAWRRRISRSHFDAQEEKWIKFPTTGNRLGNGSQKELDWSRQTLESKTRALFQPPLSCPLSSSAAATNFGSRLLIELMRDNTHWIGAGHCSEKLETFFHKIFLKKYLGSFWPALVNSEKKKGEFNTIIDIYSREFIISPHWCAGTKP